MNSEGSLQWTSLLQEASGSDVDPRTHVETLYTRIEGIILTGISGSISTVCSGLIIYLIFKSSKRFSSVYHRIMVVMSIADIITSLAMALATLPMPQDMIYTQFEGIVLGNTTSCAVQGFLYTAGGTLTYFYDWFLCIYFFLSIKLDMSDDRIAKCIEPFLHIVFVALGMLISIRRLLGKSYNPSPKLSLCVSSSYPYWCNNDVSSEDDPSCAASRGYLPTASGREGYVLWAGTFPAIICILAVIWHVYKTGKLLKFSNNSELSESEELQYRARKLEETKVVLKQGLLYIFAYGIILSLVTLWIVTDWALTSPTFQVIHITLRPLHGLFNFFIFISHKVHNLRMNNEGMSICRAILEVFASEQDAEIIVTTTDLVEEHFQRKRIREFRKKRKGMRKLITETESHSAGKSSAEVSSGNFSHVPSNHLPAKYNTVREENDNDVEEDISYDPTIAQNVFEGFEDPDSPGEFDLSSFDRSRDCRTITDEDSHVLESSAKISSRNFSHSSPTNNLHSQFNIERGESDKDVEEDLSHDPTIAQNAFEGFEGPDPPGVFELSSFDQIRDCTTIEDGHDSSSK